MTVDCAKKEAKYVSRFTCFGLTKRFNNIGFHPGLDTSGKSDNKLAPGQYTYDDKPVCMYKKYQKKSAWRRGLETEEFSRNLGYRNAEILHRRAFMASHLGPGSHDVDNAVFEENVDQIRCNGFGLSKRFKVQPNLIPAPPTYFYNVKPADIVPSTKFGKDGRFKDHERPYHLPSNRYEIKSAMRELLDKVVSTRGPYDLYSGDRSNKNTYNKFAVLPSCAPDKIYVLPTGLDYLLHDKQTRRTGKFLIANRFPAKPTVRNMLVDISLCYRNPKFPGPDHYVIPGGIKIVPEAMHSFGTSKMELRPGTRWLISPGPGRYNVKHPKCKEAKGTFVFKSKSKRSENNAPVYNSF